MWSLMVHVNWFSEIVENPETGEPNEAEADEDKPASEAAKSGYDMTDNSAYRVAGTQSSGGAQPTEEKRSGNCGDATVNFDMISNTAYSTTSYN